MLFYYDYTYWMMLLPVLLVTIYAQAKVKSNFNKYSTDHQPPLSHRRAGRGGGAASARDLRRADRAGGRNPDGSL